MRLPLAALALAVLSPVTTLAMDPPRLAITLGEKATIGGYAGMCDDLSVATITLDANATITALKVGSTICSSQRPGGRVVYRVVVEAPKKADPPAGAPKAEAPKADAPKGR